MVRSASEPTASDKHVPLPGVLYQKEIVGRSGRLSLSADTLGGLVLDKPLSHP